MLAYLLGTFPSAPLVARSRGIDITRVGSGNPGASNVARVMGARWGVAVFALDGAKGAIPAAVGLVADDRHLAYVLVACSVLGHMYPATRRFQGGKGVATLAGAMFVLHPLTSLALTVVWAAVRKATNTASLASLAIAIGLPVGVVVERSGAWELAGTVLLSALVLARHLDNIKRLLGGTELSAQHDRATGGPAVDGS